MGRIDPRELVEFLSSMKELEEIVQEEYDSQPTTKGILYRLFTSPKEIICPRSYKVGEGGVIEESEREFPLIWRKEYKSFLGDIASIKLKKRLLWTNVVITTYEGEEYTYDGLDNDGAQRLKRRLEKVMQYSRGITLRGKKGF
jgi:hypothetical protein